MSNEEKAKTIADERYPDKSYWIGSGDNARLYDPNATSNRVFIEGYIAATAQLEAEKAEILEVMRKLLSSHRTFTFGESFSVNDTPIEIRSTHTHPKTRKEMSKMPSIRVGDFVTLISEEELQKDLFEVDFDGFLKVQIKRSGTEYNIVNAMDGWGDNVMETYHNAPIIIYP